VCVRLVVGGIAPIPISYTLPADMESKLRSYDAESVSNEHVNTVLYYLEHADIEQADLLVDGGILPGLARVLVVVNDIYFSHGMTPPFRTALLASYTYV